MAKVDYFTQRATVYEDTTVYNINLALDGLDTESTNIDTTNVREEGLDRSVVRPEYQLYFRREFNLWPNAGEQIPLTEDVWTTLVLGGTDYQSTSLPFLSGDVHVIRASLTLMSRPGDPFGLPVELVGVDPKILVHRDPILFQIRLTTSVNGGGFTPTANNVTERAVGGFFNQDTEAADNEVAGRHGTLTTMMIVPNLFTAVPVVGGTVQYRLEYKTLTQDIFQPPDEPVVGQANLTVVRFPVSAVPAP